MHAHTNARWLTLGKEHKNGNSYVEWNDMSSFQLKIIVTTVVCLGILVVTASASPGSFFLMVPCIVRLSCASLGSG
jgi:hypothetical protein